MERVYRSTKTGVSWTIDLDHPEMQDGTRKALIEQVHRGELVDLGTPGVQNSEEF